MDSSLHQAPPSMGFSRQELLKWVAISFSRDWAAALSRDPPARASPRTPAPDRPGTGWDRAPSTQLRTRALGPPSCLPCPSPHSELRESQTPRHWTPSSELGTRNLYSAPDPENQTSPRSPRDAPGPWGVRPSVSHPRPSRDPGLSARRSRLTWAGQGGDLAGPGRAAFSPSAALAL